jgi:hypothetical protein
LPIQPPPVQCLADEVRIDTNGNGVPNKYVTRNWQPIANDGPAQTFEVDNYSPVMDCEQTVRLDGIDSRDPMMIPCLIHGNKNGRTKVTVDDASSAIPSFALPSVYRDTLTFELTVDDGQEIDTIETSARIFCEPRG